VFIVFDLDGTLIDGYGGIAHALEFAMEELGVAPLPLERVRGMVGRGLERLLEEAVGAELAPRGVVLFRERYGEIADEETVLMPDVPDVLDRLRKAGHSLAVASNKPESFSRRILAGKGVAALFLGVAGPDGETPPKPDPTMIFGLRQRAGATAEETVIVGDMEIDAETALHAGCRSILVPGGSRTVEELAAVPADAHLSRLAELPDAIERWSRTLRRARPTIISP
jgi:phosphoglycolate phosphatase